MPDKRGGRERAPELLEILAAVSIGLAVPFSYAYTSLRRRFKEA